jgi:hypothetical protein
MEIVTNANFASCPADWASAFHRDCNARGNFYVFENIEGWQAVGEPSDA